MMQEYVDRVIKMTQRFPKCTTEQALCYSVEHVVEGLLPTQALTFDQAVDLVDDISLDEDIDTPVVERIRSDAKFAGVASHQHHVIGLKSQTNRLIVCHEMAHVLAGFGHDDLWRGKFVRLVRAHVSVQHASLLHTLYQRVGLPTEAWSA